MANMVYNQLVHTPKTAIKDNPKYAISGLKTRFSNAIKAEIANNHILYLLYFIMAKLATLTLLVNALNKAEKRYFKLYTNLQQGTKDYLILFDLLEQRLTSDAIKTEFIKIKPGTSIEATSKYLYQVITDCLLHLRLDENRTARLAKSILTASVLFEKSMYEEGFGLLKKTQTEAGEFGEYSLQLWAARLELYYLCNLNFHSISEIELVQKQMKINELLRYSKNIQQHTALYELLRHRLLYKGQARSKQHKEELNDLLVSELNVVANPLADNFESDKLHLLFQAHYFITTNDYKSALKTFYELHTLLEKHDYLWTETPVDYLSLMEGILESLNGIGQYDDMDFFLEKLRNLKKESVYFEVMTERVIFIYSITGLLKKGAFEKALTIKNEFEETLFKKINYLDMSKQAEVYLYTAFIYLGCNNINKSHKYLNQVLLESKLFHALPVYRTFRLVHLLVHYELGNHEYIEYETRSLKRQLNSAATSNSKVEKIILKFLLQPHLPPSAKEREKKWQSIEKEFKTASEDRYEQHLLNIFDFATWIEAKLCKKSFAALCKEKYKTLVQ
jgi:hypothetical protein